MRLAVVSDIHGNLPALEAVLAEIGTRARRPGGEPGRHRLRPLWPRETAACCAHWPGPRSAATTNASCCPPADRMGPADAFARARLGDDDLRWLAALPATLDLGDGIWCCHGTPASDLQYFLETVTPDLGRDGAPGVRAATAAEVAQRLGSVTRRWCCAATPTCRAWRAAAARWSSTPAASACRPSTTTTRTRTSWKPAAARALGVGRTRANGVVVVTVRYLFEVRDIEGIVETTDNDYRPTVLTNTHKYNLRNQGWPLLIATATQADGDNGAPMAEPLSKTFQGVGYYPSNSDIIYLSRLSAANRADARLVLPLGAREDGIGNTPAAEGHYILPYFDKNRQTASGITGTYLQLRDLTTDRPVSVAFFAGRVFYLMPTGEVCTLRFLRMRMKLDSAIKKRILQQKTSMN